MNPLPDRILALLARVESMPVEDLCDPRVFGREAVDVIEALVAEGKVVREGRTVRLA